MTRLKNIRDRKNKSIQLAADLPSEHEEHELLDIKLGGEPAK